MGCSTLYHLAEAGVDAVLLERNRLTSGTTWHSAAQVRALRSLRDLTELVRYSIALYRRLEEETGQATGWINKGSLSIATTPDRLVHLRRQAALAKAFGMEAELVGPDEAAAFWPLMEVRDVIGAVWSPGDGRVSPSDLCAALVKGARRRGSLIFENAPVNGISIRGGRVRSVETSLGTVHCEAVAICSGLWSREVGALAGIEVPLWPCEHFYLLTKPVPGVEDNLPTLSDHDAHLYIRDDSGGLLVGCFEPHARAVDPATLVPDFRLLPEDWEHFEPVMKAALHRLPCLAEAGVRTLLNGPESFTPDGAFLLGEMPETSGLYLGCGMNSVGVATAGGAGMALAQTIAKGRSPFNLAEIHPARFPTGTWSAEALAARAPEVLGRHYEIAYPGRQWQTARDLRPHPLRPRFEAAGARFGQAQGWERPLFFGNAPHAPPSFGRPPWFEQVGTEVRAAHERAALFDLTPMGVIDVDGADALPLLEQLCANRIDRPAFRMAYTQMLNEAGGIKSDLTVLRLSETRFQLTVGTAARRHDLARLRRHAAGLRITVRDRTEEVACLGLTGPESAAILRSLGAHDALELARFGAARDEVGGLSVLAARLSYFGEMGWEISCNIADLPPLWDLLTQAGAEPAGLHAQTSMRIEKRFLSQNQDIDSHITPLDAGLDFAVAWNKEFVGREALLRQRGRCPGPRIAALVLDDPAAVPIGDEPLLAGGMVVGQTTSAAFGYRVGRPVAIGRFGTAPTAEQRVHVDIANQRFAAVVQNGSAFDPAHRRLG